jgi:nucleoside-diphosphate-sugar epimerase
MRGGEIQVNGPDEALDFTYADDTAAGISAVTLAESITQGTYNITRGAAHTLLEAAELAVKIAGAGTIKINNRDQNFPSRGSLNIDAAHRDLDYTPKFDIEQGFRLYHEWLKNTLY